jgi:hypothetical protein
MLNSLRPKCPGCGHPVPVVLANRSRRIHEFCLNCCVKFSYNETKSKSVFFIAFSIIVFLYSGLYSVSLFEDWYEASVLVSMNLIFITFCKAQYFVVCDEFCSKEHIINTDYFGIIFLGLNIILIIIFVL